MSSSAARAGLLALSVANVVLLALLFSRSSAPVVGALGRAGLEQDFEAGHGRKLLTSLVGEELAENPEEFRRRLQQAFQFANCFSTYQSNNNYLQMDCPFFVIPSKSASTGQPYTPTSGATFAVVSGNNPSLVVGVDGSTSTKDLTANGKVQALEVQAQAIEAQGTLTATNAAVQNVKAQSVEANGVKVVDGNGAVQVLLSNDGTVQAGTATVKQLSVQGKTQFGDLEAANLAVSQALSVQGSSQFAGNVATANLAAANLAVSKSLSVQGSSQFAGNVGTANLAVSKSLSVQGSTQFGNLAVINLNVTSLLRSSGRTQLGDLSIGALTVSGAASFGGDVTAAKSLDVRGKVTAQGALLDNAEVKGEIKTRTMIASSNVAVRGDFWVTKDFTTNGQVIARAGLVAKTCTCANKRV